MKNKAVRILSIIMLFALVSSASVFAIAENPAATGDQTVVGSEQNEDSTAIGIDYRTHIQNDGWESGWTGDGELSGTEGRSLRLEGIQIKLTGDLPAGAKIQYRTHVQNDGWEPDWTADGETAGTEGRSLRLEGIQIELVNMPDYSVQYRTHVQNDGWETKWSADGETAGTEGRSLRLEGIEIRIVNLTAYKAVLATIAKLTKTDYTAASWENLQTVMVANTVSGNNDQATIDSATAAIQAADDDLELNKKITRRFKTAGLYGPSSGNEVIDGDVYIQGSGVVIRNYIITGKIVIGEEVGSGEVSLQNITAVGETIIFGGGKVALEGGFESIILNRPDSELAIKGSTIIEKIIVSPVGSGSEINLNSAATVNNIVFNGSSDISGAGTIKNAEVNANAVTYEKVPEHQIVSPEVIVPPLVKPVIPTPSPGGGGSSTVAVTGIAVDKVSLTLMGVNATDTIMATIQPTNATNPNITWSSSDETVAKVSNGIVTAFGLGTADITASATGNAAIKAVTTVVVESPPPPPAPSYTIDYSSETTAEIIPDTVEYADNGEFTAAKTGTGGKVVFDPGDTAKTLYFRVKAAGSTSAGEVQILDIPASPPSPTESFIDGINQIVGATANTSYVGNILGSPDMAVMKSDTNGIIDCSYADGVTTGPGKTELRLRYPAGLSCFASAWTSTITVTQIKSIAVTTPPTKTVYTIGSSLDLAGLVVTGTSYENDTACPLTITVDNISGFDSTTAAAVQTLTVTVGGKQASFNISVKAEGFWLSGVSSDDVANTISGLTSAMEFSEDGTHWTAYDATTPNLPVLTGKITLQVRMAETATQTAGPADPFTFTKAVSYTVMANGTVGTAAVQSVTTTVLTLTFDSEPTGLSIDNIYLNGAQKGVLTEDGTTWKLTISQVAGVDPGDSINYFVKVYITSPDPDAYTIVNTGKAIENISLAPKLTGEKLIAYFVNQPTSFQLRFKFTETVTYYYVLQEYTEEIPPAMSPEEIKNAPTEAGTWIRETLYYKSIVGLTPLTKYVVYLYAEDSAGNPALFYNVNSLTPTAMLTVTTTDYSDGDKAWLDAKEINETGTYEIPKANQTTQEAKTAWVQTAVNAVIKYGSTATVIWNSSASKYEVSVVYGTSQNKTTTITVTEAIE